jgi:hypothetical protein
MIPFNIEATKKQRIEKPPSDRRFMLMTDSKSNLSA